MRFAILLTIGVMAGLSPAGAADLGAAAVQPGGHHGAPAAACGPGDADTVIAPVEVELRIGPSRDYERLAMVPPCQPLELILCGYRTGWCMVRYGRYDGWLFDPPSRTISHYFLGH
jgi:hypothetical protein